MRTLKHGFQMTFSILLICMTSGILLLYDNVKTHTEVNKQTIVNYLDNDLQLFTLAMAKELDPDYEILTFRDSVPLSMQDEIRAVWDTAMQQARSNLENDKDFVYAIENTKTNKKLASKQKINNHQDALRLASSFSYNDHSDITIQGDIELQVFQSYDIERLLNGYSYFTTFHNSEEEIGYVREGIPISDVQINLPKNMKFAYQIPQQLTSYGYIASYVNSWQNYNSFSAIAILVCSSILALFIICYPIRTMEEVNPFKTVKKWKAGFQIIVLATLVTCGFMGVMILSGHTLNGFFEALLTRYEISFAPVIVLATNFAAWLLTLIVIAMSLFQIKYIFAHGFLRYLKEDTFTGSLVRYIKRKINAVYHLDLSDDSTKHLLKYVLLHTCIILLISTMWVGGYLFAILYGVCVFLWLEKKLQWIQKDYAKVVQAAKDLGEGNFNTVIEDVGIFHALKDAFGDIRDGFGKAVEEETKSQNMKTELISNVSHDLKTPLTCIKNYIVLLQNDQLSDATRQEYLSNLHQYTNRLTTLIEDLFDVSKVNSGNMKLELMDVNVIALIEQAQAECSDLLEERDLSVITNFDSREITLLLDGGKTYRVLENLFTNIAKYAMPQSRVYLVVKEMEDSVRIEFKNISKAPMNFTAEEITERFVRGDKSRHEGGSGLGLAIVKSFTEVQHGSFEILIDGDLFKAILTFPKVTYTQKNTEEGKLELS